MAVGGGSPYADDHLTGGGSQRVDYLFQDKAKQRGEVGWGAKVCFNTGVLYGLGMAAGGAWGLYEGLRVQSAAMRTESTKLRVNTVLNAVTRRGPLVGNSAGVLTMFYTTFAHGIAAMRGGEEDVWNDVAAASISGALFKSTAGVKPMAQSGLAFGLLAAVASAAHEAYVESGGYSPFTRKRVRY
jgi:import inner membrane translocase subunit TIM23